MKITSERKIVTTAVAAFVAFTTITNAVVVQSPQRVLNARTALKVDLKRKDIAMKPPREACGFWLAAGVLFISAAYAVGPDGFVQADGYVEEQVNVYRMAPGPPYTSNPLPPDTVALIQELP